MIDLISLPKWRETTSGERLLFSLLGHHEELKILAQTLRDVDLRLARRYVGLSNYFFGASALHLQQRLIRMAYDVRQVHEGRFEQLKELRAKSHDTLNVTTLEFSGTYSDLMEEVLNSCEQSGKEASATLKKNVLRSASKCYSCGRLFNDQLRATADHVWPRSLGGDSILENLLPACEQCNSKKGNLALWQMAWAQQTVFSEIDEIGGLETVSVELKMALHMRAAVTYASNTSSSLRDAFIAIGPREDLTRVDPEQGFDFFNLRVHDEARTSVKWMPS